VRDAELYRRPPFLVGDEPSVLRYRRGFRTRSRVVQGAFGALVVGVAVGLSAVGAGGILPATAAFAAVSSAFVVLHLAVGKRRWMQPVEAYEDGVIASEVTALFCKRRFVAWTEVADIGLRPTEGAPPTLHVWLEGGRHLESVPGEFDERQVAAMSERLAKAKAEAAAHKAVFEAVGKEAGGDG
jgi:hypothetical protein